MPKKDYLLVLFGQGEYAIVAESNSKDSLEAICNPAFHEVIVSREQFEDYERRTV